MEIILDRVTEVEQEDILTATPEELGLDLDLAVLDSNVECRLKHRRVDNQVFLDGQFFFDMKVNCMRCLEEFRTRHRVSLKLILQLVPDDKVANEDQDGEQFIVFPESKQVFNLDNYLRELITLEIPLQPLCKSDCRGLCQECGTNLNKSGCDCQTKKRDTRWDDLQKLTEN